MATKNEQQIIDRCLWTFLSYYCKKYLKIAITYHFAALMSLCVYFLNIVNRLIYSIEDGP